MVFQSYAIWPHMSVFENAAFPLRYGEKRLSAGDIRERVNKVLALVQLGELADRPAPNLSGGQQQRLALARAFVMEPKVLLLDEPLSNLDAKLREEMRSELRALVKATGVTTIFVTHEQIEALTLSDAIAVMHGGRIAQEGPPLDIYRAPNSAFVADFIGHSNLVPGTVVAADGADGGSAKVKVQCASGILMCTRAGALNPGAAITVAIRPEHLELEASGAEGENRLRGRLESTSFVGNFMDCRVRIGEQSFKVQLHPDRTPPLGSELTLYVMSRHCLALGG